MEYKTSILFMFILKVVCSRSCGTEDLYKFFDSGVDQCNSRGPWSYRLVSVGSNDDVTNFLTPSSRPSCITSHLLPMTRGDVIEVSVYTKSIVKHDYLTVIAYEAAEQNIAGKATLSKEEKNDDNGWHIIKIILDGPKTFYGYVMLMGAASSSSELLVGSVCYSSLLDDKPQQHADIEKLTVNYRAPDVYVMQTDSVLKELVHANVAPVIANDVLLYDNDGIENRAMRFINFEDFWTPLTISLAVAIPVIILALLGWGCYALGKRKGAKQEPDIIYEDVNNLPKPYLVPRVKNVYSESVAGSSYGGRNNNIYSV